MRQRFVRTLPWMMVIGMAVGMAAAVACPAARVVIRGGRRWASLRDGGCQCRGDAAVRPLPRINAREALGGETPRGRSAGERQRRRRRRRTHGDLVLNDDEVLEEYDPWEPFNRKMFAFNRQLDRLVLKPVATVWIGPSPIWRSKASGTSSVTSACQPAWVNNLFQRNIGRCRPRNGTLFPERLDGRARLLRCGPRSWASPRAMRTPVRPWASMVPDPVPTWSCPSCRR